MSIWGRSRALSHRRTRQTATFVVGLLVGLSNVAAAQELPGHEIPRAEAQADRGPATPAEQLKERKAQEAFSDWQGRQRVRHAQATQQQTSAAVAASGDVAAQAVTNPLALLTLRFFPDQSGNTVIVGEVQNNTASTLSFALVRFSLSTAGGALLGTGESYVFGSQNARLAATGSFTSVLPPSAIGFFKVWTTVPFASVGRFSFSSEAETHLSFSPRTSLVPTGSLSLTPNAAGGTDYGFQVLNNGTDTTAYFAMALVAGYDEGGVINDVDFSFVTGSSVTQCGVTTNTAIVSNASAPIDSSFLRGVTSLGRLAFEWDEVGVSPSVFFGSVTGGNGTANVFSQCPWTATSNSNWITVTGGASGSGDGTVSFAVSANNTGVARSGSLTIAGATVTVNQAGPGVVPAITTHPSSSTIAPGQAVTLTVTASGTAPLSYQWYAGVSGDTSNLIQGATAASYTTPSLQATARYWVRVSNTAGSANSSTATVTVTALFTDPVLTSGVSPVKGIHVLELRTRVNAARSRAGLSAFSWTDSITTGVTPIKAVHIAELRSALAAVYQAAFRTPPTYTDSNLVPGVTTMKAAHLLELRNAVIGIE
jgi:hypothetical protein